MGATFAVAVTEPSPGFDTWCSPAPVSFIPAPGFSSGRSYRDRRAGLTVIPRGVTPRLATTDEELSGPIHGFILKQPCASSLKRS